jgi:hypothetical protein
MPFKYQVYLKDLNLVVANWKLKFDADPCADVNHKDSGMPFKYRVYLKDLNLVVGNWKAKAAALPGDCPRP